MARGPGGNTIDTGDVRHRLSAEAAAFVEGLEAAIDRAMDGHRPGDTFLYGIHQELPDGVADAIARIYTAAGWSEATVRRGPTGAHNVVLIP